MAGNKKVRFGNAEIQNDGFYTAEEMKKVRGEIISLTEAELKNLKSELTKWINGEVSISNWWHLEKPEAREIISRLNVMLKNRYPDFDIKIDNPMYTLSFILNKEHGINNLITDIGRNFDVELFRALLRYQSQNETYKNTKLRDGDEGGRADGVASVRTLKAFETSFDGIDKIKEEDKITNDKFASFVNDNFGEGKTPSLEAVNELIEYIIRNKAILIKKPNANIKTIQKFLADQQDIKGIMVDKNGKVVFNNIDGEDVENVSLVEILSQGGRLKDSGIDGYAGERTLQALRVYKESLKPRSWGASPAAKQQQAAATPPPAEQIPRPKEAKITINSKEVTLAIFRAYSNQEKIDFIESLNSKNGINFEQAKPFLKAGIETGDDDTKIAVIYQLAELGVSIYMFENFLQAIDKRYFFDSWIDRISDKNKIKFKLFGQGIPWEEVRRKIKRNKTEP